jgi:uncharacterized membrane protein
MTHQHLSFSTDDRTPSLPIVRTIGYGAIRSALAAGFADFWAMPTHVIFLAIIYPIVGLLLARLTMGEGLLPLAYPVMAGFALLGPFAAVGLYEVSRQRERGLDVSWRNALDVLHAPARRSIAVLGFVQLMIFAVWLAVARALYTSLMGDEAPASVAAFFHRIFTTEAGWTLIIAGNAIGFLFAAAALTLSVVSFPLLLDRDIGANAAMLTSMQAVLRNPGPMALWGLVVAVALFIGSVPLFIGLAIVMPILGHATWHLYREVISPEG